jgi:Flp pilus assembly protein TadG
MKNKLPSERGQAIIVIALAAIALIAMTALAIDGGNVYSERRRAQNAADTTVLDSALAKVRGQNMYTEGLARAASNNYADTDPNSGSSSPDVNVEIYNPPISGPYAGNSEYIQTIITAKVYTYFGRVIGIRTITNKVEAVARAKPPLTSAMAFGNAVVGLSPHDCQAVKYQGGAGATVTGGGIFVNSDCNTAFFNQSNAGSLTIPCLQTVGGYEYNDQVVHIGPPVCIEDSAPPLPPIVYPNPVCSGPAHISADYTTLSPGSISGQFPPSSHGVTVSQLQPGIYCVDGDFRMNAGDTLTGHDVLIVMISGNVTWNGGATLQLDAPSVDPFKGLLLFMPENNHGTISINGSSNSTFTGTFLAPSADITVDGSGGVSGMNSQIIGNTVYLSGNSSTLINYNDEDNYDAPVNPAIELVQ